jgi:hypothetical protein
VLSIGLLATYAYIFFHDFNRLWRSKNLQPVIGMSVDAFTAAVTTEVTTGATVPLQERLTHLLTRTAEDVAFEVATNLILQSPALADLEHLLGLPQTAPPHACTGRVFCPCCAKRT